MTAAEELDAVLAVLERRKLRPRELQVGTLRVIFAQPMPDAAVSAHPSKPDELEALRKRAKLLFGKAVPDDELEQMRGAL